MLINVGISTVPAFFIAIFQFLVRKYFMQLCTHKTVILYRNEKNPRGNIKFYTFDCINCRAGVKCVDDEFTIRMRNQHRLSVCADEHLHHSFYAYMKTRFYWTRVDKQKIPVVCVKLYNILAVPVKSELKNDVLGVIK